MKLKNLLYIAILGTCIAACSSDEVINDGAANKVKVNITTTQDGIDGTIDTRATDEMPVENSNLMYNLILLHYDSNMMLVESDVQQCNGTDLSNGVYKQYWAPTLTAGSDDYIVLLANLKYTGSLAYESAATWKSTALGGGEFTMFKQAMIDLPLVDTSTGMYDYVYNDSRTNASKKKMFMLGYYHGAVTSGKSLNIAMGRMASCVKLVITPTTDKIIKSVEILNAAGNTHFFPATNNAGIKMINYKDVLNQTAAAGTPLTLYYYVGENILPSAADSITTAKITVGGGYYTTTTATVYTYSNTNLTSSGYTLADDNASDTYYQPRYYGTTTDNGFYNSFDGVEGYYLHRYKYTYKDFRNKTKTGYTYADSQPADAFYWISEDEGYDCTFSLADDTSLDNYYRYNVTDVTLTSDSKTGYYKHRYSKVAEVKTWVDDGTNVTYTVKLGCDSPGTSNRNYSLYRNNTYTFNINLK
jgi:hypothetical protein